MLKNFLVPLLLFASVISFPMSSKIAFAAPEEDPLLEPICQVCENIARAGGKPCEDYRCQSCSMCKSSSLFGKIAPPPGVAEYGDFQTGMIKFANNLLKLIITGAAIFAFINIIIAGYNFLGAGGDSKKIESAWSKIWQSFLGLLIVAGSFVLAAIFGYLIFGDPGAILSPQIYGPPSN